MVHACKNQELLARLRKSLPPRGVATSMHGIIIIIISFIYPRILV